MNKIFSILFGKQGLVILWYVGYYAFITSVSVLLISIFVWIMEAYLIIYNLFTQILGEISISGDSAIGSQIFGMLNCMGVIDGINSGLPVLLSSISIVLFYFISMQFYKFYQMVNQVFIGFKPS